MCKQGFAIYVWQEACGAVALVIHLRIPMATGLATFRLRILSQHGTSKHSQEEAFLRSQEALAGRTALTVSQYCEPTSYSQQGTVYLPNLCSIPQPMDPYRQLFFGLHVRLHQLQGAL